MEKWGVKTSDEMSFEKKQEFLEQAEISLMLSTYDDIFSDFDPRPFSQRALSVDFLDEAKRATRELKNGQFQLRLLIPQHERKVEKELIIKKRLREHFKKHKEILEREQKKIFLQGSLFVVFGIIFMFVASYLLFIYPHRNLPLEFLIVILQPGGWFLFWEGLDLIIFEVQKKKPEFEFYNKMSKAEIIFTHYQ